MKAIKIYNEGNKEVIVIYNTDTIPSFLYFGFDSEKEAKQAVIDERISKQSISNDIEAYQARCEAEEYVNRGNWIDII